MQIDFSPAIGRARGMVESAIENTPSIIAALVLLVFFYLVARVLAGIIQRVTERRSAHRPAAIVLGRLARALVILIGILFAASVAFPTFRPGDVVQILGIGGVAAGFAFKDILQNFLAGILLLLTQPFRINDEIVAGDFEGVVSDIQTRATFLRTYDNRRVVIPNAELFTSKVIVNTAYDKRRVEQDIEIGYGDDLEATKVLLADVIKHLPETLPEPSPDVLVKGFSASGVTIRLRWWIRPPKFSDLLESRDQVLLAVKKTLGEHGIDLPFPTHQVLFHDQTEATDGDRARQCEGWPAGKGDVPKPRSIADAVREFRSNGGSAR
jgi:small-conductance mechanosensitive channel